MRQTNSIPMLLVASMAILTPGCASALPSPSEPASTPVPTFTSEPTLTVTPTYTPTPTLTPEPTLTDGEHARQLATFGVTHNADWTPYVEESNGVLMALVPAGCFRMGSKSGDKDELPVHRVCFEEPFWIDVYEVTNEAYGSLLCEYFSSEPTQPRPCVLWMEAVSHCEARGARLPTEAEWEYAARGPDSLVYPWGNEWVRDNLAYMANSDSHTQEVGSKPGGMSWVGAHDMSGNLWEWVNDWYGGSYYSTLEDGAVNPRGPGAGSDRVLRGGSWSDAPDVFRSSERLKGFPGETYNRYGFRCASDAAGSP